MKNSIAVAIFEYRRGDTVFGLDAGFHTDLYYKSCRGGDTIFGLNNHFLTGCSKTLAPEIFFGII
ncbi:MAG: hypothetical protein LBQ75_07010 [Zoogloeaceae bacterium]|nr:hypothetical protein [Zoogloeaceae bacterium]